MERKDRQFCDSQIDKYRPEFSYEIPLSTFKERYEMSSGRADQPRYTWSFHAHEENENNLPKLLEALKKHKNDYMVNDNAAVPKVIHFLDETKANYLDFDWNKYLHYDDNFEHRKHYYRSKYNNQRALPAPPDSERTQNTSAASVVPHINAVAAILSSSAPPQEVPQVDWETLPRELVLVISDYLAPVDVVHLAHTSRRWRSIAVDNTVWKKRVIARWPTTNGNVNMKSWYSYYWKKDEVNKKIRTKNKVPHPIENCSWEFQCPMAWEDLDIVSWNKTAWCKNCSEVVWYVSNVEEFNAHANLGHCVAVGGLGWPTGVLGMPRQIPT